MKHRQLGTGGPEVSALGLGCMGMSYGYGPAQDTTDMVALIRSAVEQGVTFFDTAEVYGARMKNWSARRSNRCVNKWSLPPSSDSRWRSREDSTAAQNAFERWSKPRCNACVPRSSIFYQHRVDPDVPIEDVAGTVKDLISEGKVRYFGLSEASVETIRRAHAVQPVAAVQSEYSLWWREPEERSCRAGGTRDWLRSL